MEALLTSPVIHENLPADNAWPTALSGGVFILFDSAAARLTTMLNSRGVNVGASMSQSDSISDARLPSSRLPVFEE